MDRPENPDDLSAYIREKKKNESEEDMLDISAAIAQMDAEAEIQNTAEMIWRDGMALRYICSSCHESHVGDEIAIQAMILSYAATRIINSEGIHISLSGAAGTGKSHAAATAAKHLPPPAVLDARLSNKALYYHDIMCRTVLIMDDQELTEDMQELIKVASTDWNKPAEYLTVNNQKAVTLTLPPKCPFWIVKANLNGDEQILDRQLVIWTDEGTEQRKQIQGALFSKAADPNIITEVDHADICRQIWRQVPPENIVIIPYAEEIECDELMDPRNIKLLLDLIRAAALMNGTSRVHPENQLNPDQIPAAIIEDARQAGTVPIPPTIVTAEYEDFKTAAQIINPLLQNKGGSQKLKLSSAANRILDFLAHETTSRIISYEEIRNRTRMSIIQLSRAINGRADRGTDGLLAVCPSIEIVDETIVRDGGGTYRRKALKWDYENYQVWRACTGMFFIDPKKAQRAIDAYWVRIHASATQNNAEVKVV